MKPLFKTIGLLIFIFITSCEDIINEENLENDRVTVIAPLENTIITAGEISFNWEPVEGANNYTIQVAQPDFIRTEQLLLQQTDSTTSAVLNMPAGSYQLRVRAENGAFTSPYSTISFTVQ